MNGKNSKIIQAFFIILAISIISYIYVFAKTNGHHFENDKTSYNDMSISGSSQSESNSASKTAILNSSDSTIDKNSTLSSENDHKNVEFMITEYVDGEEESNTIILDEDLQNLCDNIVEICKKEIGSIGFIYYDIDSKKSIMINPRKEFKAASTIKVPLNMMLYDEIFEQKLKITDTMVYDEELDYEDGAGVILSTGLLDNPVTLSNLAKYSIMYSDNIATNMIIRFLGDENRNKYLEEITGMPSNPENFISPESMLKILLKLYNNKDKNPYYKTLIYNMKHTVFNDRIDALIPKELVAHKIGDYENYVNDIGIVYTPHPYVIIFYTEFYNYETIAEISSEIYNYQVESVTSTQKIDSSINP